MVQVTRLIGPGNGPGPSDGEGVAWRPSRSGIREPSPNSPSYLRSLGDRSQTTQVNLNMNMKMGLPKAVAFTARALALLAVSLELMSVLAATDPLTAANSTGATPADGYVESVFVPARATHDG